MKTCTTLRPGQPHVQIMCIRGILDTGKFGRRKTGYREIGCGKKIKRSGNRLREKKLNIGKLSEKKIKFSNFTTQNHFSFY